ncbi:hypothetical protein MWE_0395 [Helicobacter pylori XZ274]|nr:hypothetical protein MWE_0395 [Helicobacter pylori XZ274]
MLKAFLWANTKQKASKAKKMTKFFQNDKKVLSCYLVMLFLSLAHSY